jgi:P4 family phage/plasmid primase-like protien
VTFSDHDPRDLITKLAPVDYDPAAACPLYDKFLGEVQPKPEMRRFLHQWLGLSLTGDVSEQRLAVWWGKGKNGKSVLMDTVAHVAGDYGATTPIETFLAEGKGRNAGQATPDLAVLPGVRMLRTSEPKRNAPLDEALIKLATGGEEIKARHLNRDYFNFYPQFKLTISGNYRPKITGSDEGIWRRVMLVPWTYTVPEESRDRHLFGKLKAEASGILNRLLEGLCDWLDHGLVEPHDVGQATAEYREDSDPLGRFLDTCVRAAPGQRVQSSVLASTVLRLGQGQRRDRMDAARFHGGDERARLSHLQSQRNVFSGYRGDQGAERFRRRQRPGGHRRPRSGRSAADRDPRRATQHRPRHDRMIAPKLPSSQKLAQPPMRRGPVYKALGDCGRFGSFFPASAYTRAYARARAYARNLNKTSQSSQAPKRDQNSFVLSGLIGLGAFGRVRFVLPTSRKPTPRGNSPRRSEFQTTGKLK